MLLAVLSRTLLSASSLACCVALIAHPAAAESAQACAAAYEGAQQHQQSSELLLARAELNTCLVACPATLREDCSRWSVELEGTIPSIRVRATDSQGKALNDVSGRLLATGAALPTDGTRVELDPRTYQLRFTRRDTAIERRIELAAGQRDLLVEVIFPTEQPRLATPTTERYQATPTLAAKSTLPNVYQVLGLSLGAAAVGLSVAGHARAATLRGSCAPICSDASVDVVRGLWWAAGGLGLLGAASFGVGYVGRF